MGWGANALKSWKVGRGQKKVENPCYIAYKIKVYNSHHFHLIIGPELSYLHKQCKKQLNFATEIKQTKKTKKIKAIQTR